MGITAFRLHGLHSPVRPIPLEHCNPQDLTREQLLELVARLKASDGDRRKLASDLAESRAEVARLHAELEAATAPETKKSKR
jgi:hypothetical protein